MTQTTSGISTITHFKMFKSGKHWVYAGITLVSIGSGLMLTTNALAATENLTSQVADTTSITTQSAQTPLPTSATSAAATSAAPASVVASTAPTTAPTIEVSPTTAPSTVNPTSDAEPAASQTTSSTETTSVQSLAQSGADTTSATAAEPVTTPTTAPTIAKTSRLVASPAAPAAKSPEITSATSEVSSAVSATAPVTSNAHGPVYTTDDTKLDNFGNITITHNGPYSVTWTSVDTTNKTETKTVTLDVSDIVAAIQNLGDTASTSNKLPAVKAKLDEVVTKLKTLPTNIASKLVGNALYQVVFTGTGSQALSKFRTMLDPNRYAVSDFWTGLDPVAYAADRAASETFYPAAVTWYQNADKETWELPEYNDPTQFVRATYIQNGDSTKTAVIGQGWTEEPDWVGYVSKIWYDLGYNVLMPSQRGQFLSDGNDITFGYQDKYDWLNWVKKVDERNGANSEVVFYGQSLGADTVIEAASVPGLSKSVKAVIADAGYATMPGLGGSLFQSAIGAISTKLQSLGLPAITSLPFLSYDKIVDQINTELEQKQGFGLADISGVTAASKVTVPLLLIHTEDDNFIPYTNSLQLAAANNSKIQEVWLLPGQVGGHAMASNAILQYNAHLQAFLAKALAGENATVVGPTDETADLSDHSNTEIAENKPAVGNSDTVIATDDTAPEKSTNSEATNTNEQPAGETGQVNDSADTESQTTTTVTAGRQIGTTAPTDVDTGEIVIDNATKATTGKSKTVTSLETGTPETTDGVTTAANNQNNSQKVKGVQSADNTTTSKVITIIPTQASQATVPSVRSTSDTIQAVAAADIMTAKKAAITAALAKIDQTLVVNDHSGSTVTASLLRDTTQAGDHHEQLAMTNQVASVHATIHGIAAKQTIATQPKAKATVLPQTADKPQNGLVALGASLMAMATGLFMGLRHHLTHLFG